mmetsp:Transcript_3549/g.8166  ORF Transcript_3549/g.8166 Transcript_3549/m.8166 type:complete len:249 (-) Transcript_3549:142-888(-)
MGTIDALPVGAAASAPAAAPAAPSAPVAAASKDASNPLTYGSRRISETSAVSTESDVTAQAFNTRRRHSKPQLLQLKEWEQQDAAAAGSNANWNQTDTMHLSGITVDEDMGLSLKMIAEEGHGLTDAHQAAQAAMGRGGRRESAGRGSLRDSLRSAASGGSRRGSRRDSGGSGSFHDSKVSLMSDITDLSVLSDELKGLGLKAHGKADIKSLVDKVSAEAATEQQQPPPQQQKQYFGSRQQQRKGGAT